MKLYQKRSDNNPPADYGVRILTQVLARDWNISSFMAYQLQTAEERRIKLTEEQFQVLYNLQDNTKLRIAGCAGSGKTVIAAKKAEILAQQGFKVLFTCFNKNLASWLDKELIDNTNILVSHYHGLNKHRNFFFHSG